MKYEYPNTDIAFEQLMKENSPISKRYDSGVEGVLPECRTCRFHRPDWKHTTCVFEYCPYSKKPVSTKVILRKEIQLCRGKK